MENKTTMRYDLILVPITIIKMPTNDIIKAEEAMENPLGKKGLLRITGLEVSDRKEAMGLFSN